MKFTKTQELLNFIGEISVTQYKEDLYRTFTIATGALYENVKYKIIKQDETIILYFSDLQDYYIKIEKGQKPGENNLDDVFIKKIRKWYEDKGLQPYVIKGRAPNKDTAAYLIARKIVNEGTKPKPFIQKITNDINENYSDDIVKAVNQDIKDYYAELKKQRKKKNTK